MGSADTLRLDLSISSGDTITSFRAINSPKDINNKMFYEVKFEDGSYGFIDTTSAYIVEENNEPETTVPTLQTNAYVINDNKNKIELFNLVGDEFVASGIFIDSETRVQIDKDKFDINSTYTEIKVLSNNEIITAYIKTENVRVDGVKIEIIIATILSVVCVVLATILTIYIRKNKSKMR